MADTPDDPDLEDLSADDEAIEVSSDDRTWGILVHAVAFIGLVVPFGNILGPLLVWAIKKDESAFVDENGKNALNFQISFTIYIVLALFSIIVVIGIVLAPLVALLWLALMIIAIIRTSEEQVYEYPLTIQFID